MRLSASQLAHASLLPATHSCTQTGDPQSRPGKALRRRGYDLVAFAAAGAVRSVGLEISPTAAQEGKAYLSETLGEGSTGKAEVLLADFFTWRDPDGPFDIGFDYTVGTLGGGGAMRTRGCPCSCSRSAT